MSTLGERIKSARMAKGYFQSDLAKQIGVKSAGIISNWEKDLNKPDAEKIVKLCEALGVTASFLLDYYGKSNIECTPDEMSFIEKYRALDAPGKDAVDYILEHESARAAGTPPVSSVSPGGHVSQHITNPEKPKNSASNAR